MRRVLRQYAPALLLALGLVAVPCVSAAQVLGSVAGTVKDTSGARPAGRHRGSVRARRSSKKSERPSPTAPVSIGSSTCLPEPTPSRSRSPGSAPSGEKAVEVSDELHLATSTRELRVGAIEETITVTGESTDRRLQSAAQTQTMTDRGHSRNCRLADRGSEWPLSVPAIQSRGTRDVGGVQGDQTGAQVAAHGSCPATACR